MELQIIGRQKANVTSRFLLNLQNEARVMDTFSCKNSYPGQNVKAVKHRQCPVIII